MFYAYTQRLAVCVCLFGLDRRCPSGSQHVLLSVGLAWPGPESVPGLDGLWPSRPELSAPQRAGALPLHAQEERPRHPLRVHRPHPHQ